MADGSPQLKSPLIAQGQDDRNDSNPGITMNGLDTVVVDGNTSGSMTPSHSLQQHHRGMWQLAYKDFLPNKKISPGKKQKFSDLVHKANDWLKKSPDVRVRSSETVTWMDKEERRLGDSELMVMTRRIADHMTTYHQRGLRLWLTPTSDEHIHTKKIAFCDIIPDKHDTIKTLTDKINKRIDDFQIKGKLISVQTLWVTLHEGKIDSDVIKWTESETMDTERAFILRVFYSEEDTAKETVVLKDIIPHTTDEGGYEDFETLVNTANTWLNEQADITLLNMQSVLVQKKHGSTEIAGNNCFFAIPGPHSSSSAVPVEFIRMLRLVYCKTKPGKGHHGYTLSPLTFETFTPQWIQLHEGKTSSRRERVEKMKEVFKRAEEFLMASGCDIVSAETVTNPMHVSPDSDETVPEIKWLFTLRLYLTSPALKLEEPNFQREATVRGGSFRGSSRRKKKDEENQHPGPIFLRNVVNRQYKYRWVVVGVVAFVTMSLIVALSVIYANK